MVTPRESMGEHAGGELAMLAVTAQAVALAGDRSGAADLYPALARLQSATVPGLRSDLSCGNVGYYLGLLARTAGRLEEAIHHLERALEVHVAAGDTAWAARVRCELARVLLARGDSEGRSRALAELDVVQAWTGAEGTPVGDEAAGLHARALRWVGDVNVLRCEGEIWIVTFAGTTRHLRDAKGLHWLAVLLRNPWRKVPVLALEASANQGLADD